MVLLGRLPSNVQCGTSGSGVHSVLTSWAVFPNASASFLRDQVGRQKVVLAAERIERLAEADEVAGDESRALVDQLVERMLPNSAA